MADPILIKEIKEQYRLRQDMLRAEVSLTLRISAQRCRIMCGNLQKGDRHACGRTGRYGVRPGQDQHPGDIHVRAVLPHDDGDHSTCDTQGGTVAVPASADEGQPRTDTHGGAALIADVASLPLYEARAVLTQVKRRHERELEALAVQLPVWPWVASIYGFGALGLAQIVGECGDLDNYANPAKVWKRMGLAVIDGERQRRVTGDAALDHGYNPERRARMYVIGKFVSIKPNPYREYYLTEKERQLRLYPEVMTMKDGKLKNAARARADNRAMRHMTKRLLRDLWRAWRNEEFVKAA